MLTRPSERIFNRMRYTVILDLQGPSNCTLNHKFYIIFIIISKKEVPLSSNYEILLCIQKRDIFIMHK